MRKPLTRKFHGSSRSSMRSILIHSLLTSSIVISAVATLILLSKAPPPASYGPVSRTYPSSADLQDTSGNGNKVRVEVYGYQFDPRQDGDSQYDYFIFNIWGTVDASSGWSPTTRGLGDPAGPTMQVSAYLSQGGATTFMTEYVEPKGYIDKPGGGTLSLSLGFTFKGISAGISWSQDIPVWQCDTPELGAWAIRWSAADNSWAWLYDRAYAWGFAVGVKTPEGQNVRLSVNVAGNFWKPLTIPVQTERFSVGVSRSYWGILPDPEISSVDYPSGIILGETARITVRARNLGGTASWQTLSVSFPSNPKSIKIYSTTLPQGARVWPPGSTLNAGYGTKKVTSVYPLAEGSASPWRANEEYYLTVDVVPEQSGVFQFYVKTVAADSSDRAFPHDPQYSTFIDQQDEYVYKYEIAVSPPPKLKTIPDPPSRDFGIVTSTASWQFTIANDGGGTLTWTIADDQTWIMANPTSGDTTTEWDTITVTAYPADLATGQYQGSVTISSNGGSRIGTIRMSVDETPPPAPEISSTSHQDENKWYNNNAPSFDWTTPSDSSGIAGYSYVMGQSPTTAPDQTIDTTGNYKLYMEVADGIWYFHVRAKDNAGNWGEADHYRIQIDATAPSAPRPDDSVSDWSNDNTPTFIWGASSDSGSGVAGYYWKIDSGSETWTTSTSVTLPSQTDGSHTFYVKAEDNAGNIGSPGSHPFQIDTVPPSIGLPTRTPAGDVQPNQAVQVSVSVTDITSGVKNAVLQYTTNNGITWTSITMNYNPATSLYETTMPGQPAGTLVKYKIVAYDNAENQATYDNAGQYFVYTVVPEFPPIIILPLFALLTILAIVLARRDRRENKKPDQN